MDRKLPTATYSKDWTSGKWVGTFPTTLALVFATNMCLKGKAKAHVGKVLTHFCPTPY